MYATLVFSALCCWGSLSAAATEDSMKSQEQASVLFDGSRIWGRYKKLFDRIRKARSVAAVERLDDKSDKLELKLAEALPEREQVVDDLLFLLRDEVTIRLDVLQPVRGRPPEPDYFEELGLWLDRMDAEQRLVAILLRQNAQDPWVISRLYTDFVSVLSAIEANLESAREYLKHTGRSTSSDKQKLFDRAKAALDKARVLRARLPKSEK